MRKKFLRATRKAARKGIHPTSFHGATIVRGNQVLLIGHNKGSKTHPKLPYPVGQHAEFDVLRQAQSRRIDVRGANLIVMRVDKDGRAMLSRPCQACAKAIFHAGIKRVFFTDADGLFLSYKV